MTSVTSRVQQYSQGKLRLKRWVFRRLRKTGSDCTDVTSCGRLFQTREAALVYSKFTVTCTQLIIFGCLIYVNFIVWVRSVNKMLPSVKFAEHKMLTFLILREKC